MNKRDEELIEQYYFGWELSLNDQSFPNNFKTSAEKIACLLGFNDATIGLSKDESEILLEIKKIIS